MTDRTIIPRRGDTTVEGIPDTCPECRSAQILSEHGEWRCCRAGCFAQSPGWMTRPSAPPADRIAAATDRAADLGLVEPKPASAVAPEPKDAAIGRPAASHTNAEMLGFLVAYHRTRGRSPSTITWRRDRPEGAPSVDAYYARFGSWKEALIRAGLPINQPGTTRAQPAPTASPVALAETAAAAPTSTGPTGVSAPAKEDSEVRASETPVSSPGVVEQPLPPTYAQTPARLVASRPAAVMYDDGHLEPAAEPDWREAAKRRYIETLLGCLENWDGDEFFALCDRVERVLGLQEPAA